MEGTLLEVHLFCTTYFTTILDHIPIEKYVLKINCTSKIGYFNLT